MLSYENKMIIDYIRIKLGRYDINNEKNNLRFDRDVQDSNGYLHNKKIIDLFDDYYNNKKIICMSWKGTMYFAIFKRENYNSSLWYQLNNSNFWEKLRYCKNPENDDDFKKHFNFYKFIEENDYFSTSENILNLIKICNETN